ncbi:SRPBCC family protein [Spirosoma endbachense]|uniref:SRPBCC domain-containing protein n=1 Tax=Spirosoma endbachense TaxID=2666025 RepID=A0A6P1VY52_9BACT|nr:SRPBCC domain-containing protein [Spirosoma endbachense]QHV96687.1 SRPBCC domain-containing protein [Spirosoma endbachense]
MITSNYTTSLLVDQSPEAVFNTINNVDQWWTEKLEGTSQNVNDEFTVDFPGIHVSMQKVVELIPGRKVKWLVTDSNLTSFQDKQEWTGTTIQFDITPTGDKTQIQFTHEGLVPDVECYNSCTRGWTYFIDGSLYKLFTAGKGQPGKSLPKGELN